MRPVALSIAGSDPTGGAGIQADLKTFHQFGVYGEAIPTLITVQNSTRVSRVEVLDAGLVREQLEAVLEDMPPAAAKTGALGSAEIVRVVARAAEAFSFPLVVDPVLLSTHGRPLLPEDALPAMRELMRHAALITPNLPEVEAIAGVAINEDNDLRRAVSWMFEMGARAILIKGGHRTGPPTDIFFDRGLWEDFPAERIDTRHTHGTGCTYSAAITAALAKGEPLRSAVARAKRFVHEAIRTSPGLGRGAGPLNHFADSSRGDSE